MKSALLGGLLTIAALAVTARVLLPRALILNRTASEPVGVYVKLVGTAHRGDLIAGCLPLQLARFGRRAGYLGSGECPGGAPYVIKRLVGLPGDRVLLSDSGVKVNAWRVPESAPLRGTDAWRSRVHPGTYRVRANELWVASASPSGWDSRYFGPVALSRLTRVALLR